MEERKTYKIRDIATINLSQYSLKEGWNEVTYLDTGSITENHIEDIQTFILPCDDFPSRARRKVQHNDILFSTVRPNQKHFGILKNPNNNLLVSTGFSVITVNPLVADADFVYYYLTQQEIINFLQSVAEQSVSAYPSLKSSDIEDIDIELPSLYEQQRLALILKSLDDKIKLNNRINHNLEEQAQALYKSWFVDFEPFKGLDFIDSDLGMIPSSLKIKQISTVKHILETGKRPKGGVGDLSFGIPSIGAESIKGLGFFDSSKVKYISEDFARTLKKGWIDGYELLIYKDGGKPGYFIPNYNIFGDGFPYNRMCLNEHVFKLDFLDRGLNAFAYFYFHSEYVFNYLNAQGGKAAIPGINQKDIESLWIFDPNNEYVRLFSERVSPLITTILNNCRCNMELAKTRDMLLPKLMSGELKINDLTC